MPRTLPLRVPSVLLGALFLTACRLTPPPPPPELGVHVAIAGNDTARVRFRVVVTGTLEFGIRSAMFAMAPDSTLLLATPADLLVHKGTGTAVITAADSANVLMITSLDRADSARVSARGHAVLVTRPDTTHRLTAAPVTATPPTPEISR